MYRVVVVYDAPLDNRMYMYMRNAMYINYLVLKLVMCSQMYRVDQARHKRGTSTFLVFEMYLRVEATQTK